MNPIEELKSFINIAKDGKLAILCVGNELKGDDGVGPVIFQKLQAQLNKEYLIINAHVSPENFLSVLEKEKVTHCLLIDAVEFGIKDLKPGKVGFFKPYNLKRNQEILSTHHMSLRFLLDYAKTKTQIEFVILGIQPKNVDFGTPMSEDVLQALNILVPILLSLLR